MAATQDDMITELRRANADLQRANVALRQRHDRVRARRSGESAEGAVHQAGSIDVLKAMSASPSEGKGLHLSIAYDIVTEAHDPARLAHDEMNLGPLARELRGEFHNNARPAGNAFIQGIQSRSIGDCEG